MNKTLKRTLVIFAFAFVLFTNPLLFVGLALFFILLELGVFESAEEKIEEPKPMSEEERKKMLIKLKNINKDIIKDLDKQIKNIK